jgi:hypothetical protein
LYRTGTGTRYFIQKISRNNLVENLYGSESGSGTGSGRVENSDPDPIKITWIRNTDLNGFYYYRYLPVGTSTGTSIKRTGTSIKRA